MMSKQFNPRLLLVMAAALAMVLAACGGSSSSNPQRELADRILDEMEGEFDDDELDALGISFSDVVDRSCVRDIAGSLSSSDARSMLQAMDEIDDSDDLLDPDAFDDMDFGSDIMAFGMQMMRCFDMSAMMGGAGFGAGDDADDFDMGDFDMNDMFDGLDLEDLGDMLEDFDFSEFEELFGDVDMEELFGN